VERINRCVRYVIGMLILLLVGVFFIAPATAATVAPKVAFVGDWLTDGWSTSFPANWKDVNSAPAGTFLPVSQQMAAAIALKPTYIHFMVGSEYIDDDASYNLGISLMQEDLITAITMAQAAHIPIFIGIEPIQFVGYMSYPQMDLVAYAVASKYGVPMINYSGAVTDGETGYAGSGGSDGGTAHTFSNAFFIPSTTNYYSTLTPTPAFYAIMTMMAQTAFATLNVQPKSVYLQDLLIEGNECIGCNGVPNVNTVSPGNSLQFYAVISYANGVAAQAALNTNFLTNTNGTWTSSNPAVGVVNQFGAFWAINQGTTIVKFTLPNGVWNEWIMYVGAPFAG
jgi:hypothetical protein